MGEKHYKDRLAAFVDHEPTKEEQQKIAKHLLQCGECRHEHDRVKLGASLAGQLSRSDAPPALWNEIENALNGRTKPTGLIQQAPISTSNLAGAVAVFGCGSFRCI